MNLKSSVSITVKGKVQGVWYRASTKIKAEELEIYGYVKNLPNGDVFVEAEGNSEQIKLLIEWCKEGPEFAVVEDVFVNSIGKKSFKAFTIKR